MLPDHQAICTRLEKMLYCLRFMFEGSPAVSLIEAFSPFLRASRMVKGIPLGRKVREVGVVLGIILVLAIVLAFTVPGAPSEEHSRASMLADEPVAVITPLPDYVSNGTWWTIDGSESQGVIVAYLWNVTLGEETTILHGMSEIFMFKTLGLYKITLTVTDNKSRNSTAFTAVVSVLDSDQDTLPDWWEEKYFGDLNETADGDYDGDKYDNLEEYAKGTNPVVKDPRPTFVQMIKENWLVSLGVVAIVVVAIMLLILLLGKRLKKKEKAKIEAAIAIEKALESEDK